MRTKYFISFFVLITFLSLTFFVSNSFADHKERDEVKKAIEHKKARWSARDTKISKATDAQRKKRLGSYNPVPVIQEKILTITSAPVPAQLDWRNYNGNSYVTPVKEQGECSDCWAFASAAALESNKLISNNTPGINLDLSEQTLNSCSGAGSCSGGYIDTAANFLRDIGLPVESCNPYTATDGFCSVGCSDWLTNPYKITGWYKVNPTVEAIKYALYNYGPLVALMSVYTDLYYYSSGIYSHSSGSFEGYHAVLIVGYNDAEQYFIIKDSWGEDWGETGYAKIAYSEIASDTLFGFYTIAYETTIPEGFPTLDSIPRDPNNPNTTSPNNGNNSTQLSILTGSIKDESGNAVSEAEIKIGKYKANSNVAGIYVFPSLPAGSYVATIIKSGYTTHSENLTITPSDTVTKDFVIISGNDNNDGSKAKKKYKSGGVKGAGWFLAERRTAKIGHNDAVTYYAKQASLAKYETVGTTSASAPMAGSNGYTTTPEIEQLARGLRYDPKLIYDYVHNRIDYVPYFGALKSPTLTYLDESGNDFDQAALMVALLKESSSYNTTITDVKFVLGNMTLTVAELANWFGVAETGKSLSGVVDQGRLVVDGLDDSDGPSDSIGMTRVWVSAKINNVTYVFDPAFKTYTNVDRVLDIGTAMGWSQDAIRNTGRIGADHIGTDYVQRISDDNIKTLLNNYTTSLVNAIRTQKPNSDIKEIIGGRNINQTYMTDYQASLSHMTTSPNSQLPAWGDGTSIPAAYTANIIIKTCTGISTDPVSGNDYCSSGVDISRNILTTELTGQTIWLEFKKVNLFNHYSILHIGDEELDGASQHSSSQTYLDINIIHPYLTKNSSGNLVSDIDANQQEAQLIERSSTWGGGESVHVIPYNFGGMSEKLIKKQKEKLDAQIAIDPASINSAAEALNLLGLEYFYESERSSRMVAALSDTVYLPHHRVSIAAQTDHYYMDDKFWMCSVFSKIQDAREGDITVGEAKFMKTNLSIASALESGVIGQLLPNTSLPISTVSLLKKANTDGQRIYAATTGNWDAIKSGYATADQDTIYNNYIRYGVTVILPATKVYSGTTYWLGYMAKYYSYDEVNDKAHFSLGFMIDKANGGYNTQSGNINPSEVDQNTPDEYTPPSKGTVNIIDGSYNYKHTSLQLGGGKPGLSFTHSYDTGNKNTIGSMGRGGSHNFDISLKTMSLPGIMLGKRQPVDAAAVIAGIYASLDLIRDNNGNTDNVESWVDGALVSCWITDQMINNAVVVQQGNNTLEYVKMPDSTYVAPPGNTTTLTKGNGLYTITEHFGTQHKFNSDNKISQIIDVDNNTTTFAYNSDKTLDSVSNNFGRSLGFGYDSGKVNSVHDHADRTVYYHYTNGNLDTYTDPEGKVWQYGYDANNRMITLKTPPVTGFTSGITMATNTYDSFGRVTSETVPIQGTGNPTATCNFYYSGYRNAAEDPQGHSVAHYYDDKMREIAMEDPFGKKAKQEYDGQNHVVKVTDALNHETTYTYDDGSNNVKKITNTLGYWVTNTYDSQFRLTDTTDNDNPDHNSHFTYDDHHHLLSARDPLNNTVSATYKPNGLKWTTTDANGVMTTIGYDSTYGNITTTTTGSHPAITYYYDSNNKYDIRGLRSGLKDQENSTTSIAYNKLGQLTGKTDPLTKVSSSIYDDAGRLLSNTDRKNQTITYAYAANGKLAQINYPTGSPVIYGYNNLNQLTTMQDSLGTTTYNSYDAAGRLTSMTDPHGFTISYTYYDETGSVHTITYPGNKTVVYTYDTLNRLKTVNNWLSQTATYDDYDAAGRLPGFTNFNGTRTTYGYDNASRLTAINNQKADTSVIASYAFTEFDGNGNRKNIVQNEPYAPSLGDGNVDYTYNTQKNRLLSTSAEGSFGYDDEGQLQTGYSTSYTFDYEHRLITIGSTQFNYDGEGRRLKVVRNGETTYYIYGAGGILLAEANSSKEITNYYIYGNGLLATVTSTNNLYCYHYNGIGSTVAMTDQTQAVVNQYSYDAFGNIANHLEAVAQPFKYVGAVGVLTEPNGFYYMQARYYDPKVGRFISEDPIGFAGGDVNLMAYVWSNPVNIIDPLGLWGGTISVNVDVFGRLWSFYGGGGMGANFGYSTENGFSCSLTGSAAFGAAPAVDGKGAAFSLVLNPYLTNATSVNNLNGGSASGTMPINDVIAITGVKGDGYTGVGAAFTLRTLGNANSVPTVGAQTTSALFQYNNSNISFGNTGTDSILNFSISGTLDQSIINQYITQNTINANNALMDYYGY